MKINVKNLQFRLLLSITIAVIMNLILFMFRLDEYKIFHELDLYGKTIKAIVTEIRPSDHGSLVYSYIVEGIKYRGQGIGSGACNKECNDIKISDSLTICYLPYNPEISSFCEPGNFVKEFIGECMFFLLAILFAMFFIFIPGWERQLIKKEINMSLHEIR